MSFTKLRYVVNENPDDLDFQALKERGDLGAHSLDTIQAFTDLVVDTYKDGGIREPQIVTIGKDRDHERGVISYHKVSPTQQLDQSGAIPHGGSVVPFVDMDIVLPGEDGQEVQHVKSRSIITMLRGVKDKNFSKRYHSVDAMEEIKASNLVKPFTGGLPGGSIEGFEANPAIGLKRECAEEWGLVPEKGKEEQPYSEAEVNSALVNHMPTSAGAFKPVSACLDTYQKNPLLAFGFEVDVSEYLKTHIGKMCEVQENNRAFMDGEKTLDEWKQDGANEIVAYQITPVGVQQDFGNMQAMMRKALELGGAFEQKEADPQREARRLELVKELFLDRAAEPGYTYAHEHVAVREVEKQGIDKYRGEKQSLQVNGEAVAREDVIAYVHAHLPELQESMGYVWGEDKGVVQIKLDERHIEQMLAEMRHPPAQVDAVESGLQVGGRAAGMGR